MAGEQSADHGAHVGMQIGSVAGNVNQYNAPVMQAGHAEIAAQLAAQIEDLRKAVLAARQRDELSAEAAVAAQRELDAADEQVDAAARGDSRNLMEALHRVGEVLTGGLRVLAQLASVVATVKGIK